MARFLQQNSLQISQVSQSSMMISMWGTASDKLPLEVVAAGVAPMARRQGVPCPSLAGSNRHRTQLSPWAKLSTSGKGYFRKGRKCHREEKGTPRSENEGEEVQISTTAGGDDSSSSRWICPEGTTAHGQPVLEQIFSLKNCSQWGAHTRAVGSEKVGAAERNYLTITITPHHAGRGTGIDNQLN